MKLENICVVYIFRYICVYVHKHWCSPKKHCFFFLKLCQAHSHINYSCGSNFISEFSILLWFFGFFFLNFVAYIHKHTTYLQVPQKPGIYFWVYGKWLHALTNIRMWFWICLYMFTLVRFGQFFFSSHEINVKCNVERERERRFKHLQHTLISELPVRHSPCNMLIFRMRCECRS